MPCKNIVLGNKGLINIMQIFDNNQFYWLCQENGIE